MIYDCFSFFNELDLLEIRLNVLKDVVDKFVLVEATRTHTGRPKPLYYEENKARYADFADRIIHVVVEDFSAAEGMATARETAWAVENIQRNAIAKGLVRANPADTVIISDLDEIPKPEAVCRAVGMPGITRIGMRPSCYYVNYIDYSMHGGWRLGTQILSYRTFTDPRTYDGFVFGEYVIGSCNRVPSATVIRFLKSERLLKNSGWHFSYLGGVEAVRRKISAIAHTEYCNEHTLSSEFIKARMRNGEDVFKRGDRFFAVELDHDFPQYIVDNATRFASLVFPVDAAYVRKTRWRRLYYTFKGAVRSCVVACIPACLVGPLSRLMQRLNKKRLSK